ncbi:response regulator transcription factor [Clostridium sp. MSJ-4]|uniref:Response regulator transcription factor n=1 Tax=Clostridium simiarum TaxID=2841506 RepID=A0ABS6F255_9CLOT|nr:response regulator transcription factor [Clostridium simiarum]MBU5591622.1 response regulator transcription factor [Clostridium simiarum]
MFKIIVVEDDLNIRTELNILLQNALYDVVVIENFENVEKQIIDNNGDIVLLDVNLPGKSGLEICRNIRNNSDIPIIFVTSNNTSMDELNCITMGGDDYVSKPYNVPVLLARIASILKRTKKGKDNNDTRLIYKEIVLDILAGTIKYKNEEVEMSKNELKILFYLFKHNGEIVKRADLIEYLWDNQIFIDDNTLSVNMTRIRGKLEKVGVKNFIETKRGLGYKI